MRVYQFAGETWVQLGTDIDGEAAYDESGSSVSLSADGTILAIGAYGNDSNGSGTGHVRVYQYAGGVWVQLSSDIDGDAVNDRSGWSVSLSADGTIVAIGAYANDGSADGAGQVRVYQYTSGAWTQLGTDIDGEAEGDWSGFSVSLSADGTIVAIGASYNDGTGSNAGHVRVYGPSATEVKHYIYLPYVTQRWPPLPYNPTLNAISNPDGDGAYTVSWVELPTRLADTYALQQAKDVAFTVDVVQACSTTAQSCALSGRAPGNYYYRVRGINSYGPGPWSNVVNIMVHPVFFEGPSEQEPNDDALSQANGPIISGQLYYGQFPSEADIQDFYSIYIAESQNVELWLSNIGAGHNYDLVLWNSMLDKILGHSGEVGNVDEHIPNNGYPPPITLDPGWYYIQVYNQSRTSSTQEYHLRMELTGTSSVQLLSYFQALRD